MDEGWNKIHIAHTNESCGCPFLELWSIHIHVCVYIYNGIYIHTYKEFFPHNLDFTVDSVANEFVS